MVSLLNKRTDDTVGEEGAKRFADLLSTNTSLIELSFSGSELGATGAQYLGSALKKNSTLTSLLIPCMFQRQKQHYCFDCHLLLFYSKHNQCCWCRSNCFWIRIQQRTPNIESKGKCNWSKGSRSICSCFEEKHCAIWSWPSEFELNRPFCFFPPANWSKVYLNDDRH